MKFSGVLMAGAVALLAAVAGGTLPSHASLMNVTLNYQFIDNGIDKSTTDQLTAGTQLSCPGSANVCDLLTLGTQTVDIGEFSIRYSHIGDVANSFTNSSLNGFNFLES